MDPDFKPVLKAFVFMVVSAAVVTPLWPPAHAMAGVAVLVIWTAHFILK